MNQVSLSITDMECASCVQAIDSLLRKIEGVQEVSVNFALKQAVVSFDDKQVSVESMQHTLKQAGFSADVVTLDYDEDELFQRIRPQHHSLRWQKIRLGLSLVLTLPVFFVSMLHIHFAGAEWMMLVCATMVVFCCGGPILWHGLKSALYQNLNMNVLISLGVLSSYGYSLVKILDQERFSQYFSSSAWQGLYFETTCVLITVVLVGRYVESKAHQRALEGSIHLFEQQPKTACLVHTSSEGLVREETVLVKTIQVGQTIRVKPGEIVPMDGLIESGETLIDESMVTGESFPIHKQPGDGVIGGTLNHTGSITIRVSHVGYMTVLWQLLRLIYQAQQSQPPIQSVVDKISRYFLQGVLLVALITFLAWSLWGPTPSLGWAVIHVINVLMLACPCALGLAVPMTTVIALGQASQLGVFIKDARVFEVAPSINTVVLDKTGTLTEGKPKANLVVLTPLPEMTSQTVLQLVASVEMASNHPYAQALIQLAQTHGVDQWIQPSHWRFVEGQGIAAKVANHAVWIGNETLLNTVGVTPSESVKQQCLNLAQHGQTPILAIIDAQVCAIFALTDPLKKTSKQLVQTLKAANLKVILLTGDNHITANAIGQELGVDKVFAHITPEQKAKTIATLQGEGRIVLMAGDGINDAPALAQADIGVSVNAQNNITSAASDLTLVKGDLTQILTLMRLSEVTMKVIHQNLCFAFVYNALGIPLAAGLLYPLFGVSLNPMIAGIMMSVSSLCVVFNSLRLKLLMKTL